MNPASVRFVSGREAAPDEVRTLTRRKTVTMECIIAKSDRWLNGKELGGLFAAMAFAAARALSDHSPQTPVAIHDQLARAIEQAQSSLPKKIDEDTTATGARIEGMTVINTYELSGDRDPKDITAADKKGLQASLTDGVCSGQATRPMVAKGVTYRYEYFNKGKFLGSFDVASCPITAASITPATNSVAVVLDGPRALAPLTVGGLSIYATVDTGCTDMTVNENIANRLIASNEASDLGTGDVTLADGSVKKMRHIRIATVTIGGHSVYSVLAMVVPDGVPMLLGYNVLNQVTGKFAVNTAKSTLEFN
jgi:predicted aspartyl protease